ncbi:hypothetical protein SDRG_05579 [Saprolegnia diclina VS20]|uniref:AB hydrolase-1 domain-containing protein n=1 Tax=Saprolegnia diclina (strain VS20) TaxID=1156394 RepID=T0S3M4_SAPDV|nr:hypothetical protein SDRG_05579 [Saprolegnia diclina VS20]EQC37362.1 hypothetical protein SDRG_05579 [Saprolegnia diclina VS20]|eukprot:XP_008609524.1 hypothetical protein SDRG_05579 [Saprolegnia diclina VS20]
MRSWKLLWLCLCSVALGLDVDGWFNCSANTLASTNPRRSTRNRTVECALVVLPLCHAHVCDDRSNRTVQVFVKRLVARSDLEEGASVQDIWVLQGGPGASSIAMETMMIDLYDVLDGHVNVYTMDHRGTGRSAPLQCIATQAATPGSPGGDVIELAEMPDCIQDILFEIDGHTSAFSVTSAALDLVLMLRAFSGENRPAFVYGASYGTLLVERLMQLGPTGIHGFILDGVVSQRGSDAFRHSFANWDHDVASVGTRFLDRCTTDPFCKGQVQEHNITQLLHDVYTRLDAASTNVSLDMPPSHHVRSVVSKMLLNWELRQLLPALIYRMWRADSTDIAALEQFKASSTSWQMADVAAPSDGFSMMLYYLIVFSEEWVYPTPSVSTLDAEYARGLFGTGVSALVPFYCLMTQYNDDACRTVSPQYALKHPFVYRRDAYWNATTTIPANASVLLLTGEFDAQTEGRYANMEMRNLVGSKKRMITFPDATHCAAFATPMLSGDIQCGVYVLASYLLHDGALDGIDTSCQASMRRISFHISTQAALQYFGTPDAYGSSNVAPTLVAVQHRPLPMLTRHASAVESLVVVVCCVCTVIGIFVLRHKKRVRAPGADALELVRDAAMLL